MVPKVSCKRGLMTYIMARILGEENISCSASSTWLIPTNAVPFFFERESAISTALRHISRHRRASPDTAATYEAQMVNINNQIFHSNPKRKIKRYRNDKFQSKTIKAIRSKHSNFSDVKWMKFSYSQERILNEWEVQSLVPIQRGFSLFDGDLVKLNLINKSTKILHGLYSYRP